MTRFGTGLGPLIMNARGDGLVSAISKDWRTGANPLRELVVTVTDDGGSKAVRTTVVKRAASPGKEMALRSVVTPWDKIGRLEKDLLEGRVRFAGPLQGKRITRTEWTKVSEQALREGRFEILERKVGEYIVFENTAQYDAAPENCHVSHIRKVYRRDGNCFVYERQLIGQSGWTVQRRERFHEDRVRSDFLNLFNGVGDWENEADWNFNIQHLVDRDYAPPRSPQESDSESCSDVDEGPSHIGAGGPVDPDTVDPSMIRDSGDERSDGSESVSEASDQEAPPDVALIRRQSEMLALQIERRRVPPTYMLLNTQAPGAVTAVSSDWRDGTRPVTELSASVVMRDSRKFVHTVTALRAASPSRDTVLSDEHTRWEDAGEVEKLLLEGGVSFAPPAEGPVDRSKWTKVNLEQMRDGFYKIDNHVPGEHIVFDNDLYSSRAPYNLYITPVRKTFVLVGGNFIYTRHEMDEEDGWIVTRQEQFSPNRASSDFLRMFHGESDAQEWNRVVTETVDRLFPEFHDDALEEGNAGSGSEQEDLPPRRLLTDRGDG
jgi:hypothetical protein